MSRASGDRRACGGLHGPGLCPHWWVASCPCPKAPGVWGQSASQPRPQQCLPFARPRVDADGTFSFVGVTQRGHAADTSLTGSVPHNAG